jgi:uncharacterized protein YcfJ
LRALRQEAHLNRTASCFACIVSLSLALGATAANAAVKHKRTHHHRPAHHHVVAKQPVKSGPKHPKQVCKVSVLKTHTSVGIELRRVKHCFSGEQ